MTASQSAWGLTAAEALSEAQSWTGRIHIHKLLYLASELMGVDPPFKFELYRFGPYSFDLDATVRDLDLCGLLEKEQRVPDYGPSYSPADNWRDAVEGEVSAKCRDALRQLAKKIGGKSGGELELLATCCWVQKQEGVTGNDEIVREVKKIKTRASEDAIRRALKDFRTLANDLTTI